MKRRCSGWRRRKTGPGNRSRIVASVSKRAEARKEQPLSRGCSFRSAHIVMTSLPHIFIRSHHKVFSVALSHPSSRAASGFFQSLVACRVHARNASKSLRHVVRMQASVLCARPRRCMYTPPHLSYWRFRSAALRWNQRQKNFSFDMTPLAGFSLKITRNRLYAAARILSKSVVFIQKRSRRLSHRSIRPAQFRREKRRCAQD
jgi:hypothetical protein